MAILSRKTLFSIALVGLISGTAWSQEPAPVPPEAADAPIEPVPDRPGVVQVSDCPPAGFGPSDGQSHQHVPPHSGWNPPGRRPIYRSWVPYHKFFPNAWTGMEAPAAQHRAPIVYMPTDTTQLGYYYQHAPTWHAWSGMVPPVPRPADWHYIYHREPYASPRGTFGPPTHFGAPTVVPETAVPELPSEAVPSAPADTSLDRSAGIPELSPIPQ